MKIHNRVIAFKINREGFKVSETPETSWKLLSIFCILVRTLKCAPKNLKHFLAIKKIHKHFEGKMFFVDPKIEDLVEVTWTTSTPHENPTKVCLSHLEGCWAFKGWVDIVLLRTHNQEMFVF